MMSGDFLKRLRILNPKLKVHSNGDNGRLAGIYYIGWEPNLQEWGCWDICGIDKNNIPEYPEYDNKGHMTKSGWYRVALMLEQQGFTTKDKVKKAFGAGFYDGRRQKHFNEIVSNIRIVDEVDSLIKQIQADNFKQTGSMALKPEDALDIKKVIDQKDPVKAERAAEQFDREKWALNKDAEKYVIDHKDEAEKHGKSWTETSTKQEFEDEFFKK